jgi:hypothetical protein
VTPANGRRQEWQVNTVLRCGSYVRAQVAMILAHESDATLQKEPRLSTREAARRADCRPESAQDAIAALRDLGAVVVVGVDGRKVATFRLVPAWWERDRSGGPDQSTRPDRSGRPDQSWRTDRSGGADQSGQSTDPVDRIDPVDSSDRSGGPDQSDLATDPVGSRDRSGLPSRDLIFSSESSDSDPPILSDLQIVARDPARTVATPEGQRSISSTGTETRDETPEPEIPEALITTLGPARACIAEALERRIAEPPARIDELLEPLGAPEWTGDGSDATRIRTITAVSVKGTSTPAAPRPAVRTPAKPVPQARGPRGSADERFAALSAAEQQRWFDLVDRLDPQRQLSSTARRAAAVGRWDRSLPRTHIPAGVHE